MRTLALQITLSKGMWTTLGPGPIGSTRKIKMGFSPTPIEPTIA